MAIRRPIVLVSGVISELPADDFIDGALSVVPVSSIQSGTPRQLLQTDAAGTGVEWTSNVNVPGTLGVTNTAIFDSSVVVSGALTQGGNNVVTVGDTGTVTSTMIANGTIVNDDISISGAIAGTKVSPNFGSQAIQTTGVINTGFGTNAAPSLSIGTSDTGFYSYGTDQVALSINGTDALRVDTSQRVLIGPSTTFDANSRLQVTSTSNLLAQFCRTNGIEGAISIQTTPGSLATPSANNADTGIGALYFRGYDSAAWRTGAKIVAQTDGQAWASGDCPTRLVFSVTADANGSPTTSPSAMTINSGQEVLIGYSTDNGAYKLQVNSQIFATSDTIATSDGRYKENVAALDGCVDLVKALRPVSFDWKAQEPVTRVDEDGETVVVREAHNFPDGKQVGFIAQEVEEVLADKPWLGSVIKQNVRPAVTDADGNELAPEEEFLGIAAGNLVAVLTSALKDAISRIESLEAEVAALKA